MKKNFRIDYVGRDFDGRKDPVDYLARELTERGMSGVTTSPREDEPYRKNLIISKDGYVIKSHGAQKLEIEAETEEGVGVGKRLILGLTHTHRDQRDYLLEELQAEGARK
jgi:hypothetical protein